MATATRQANEVKAGKTKVVAQPGKQEVLVSRLLDAPRERIFQAMTDAKLIPQWWGPVGYTTTVEKLEAKPGGSWRFVQKDPAGNVHAFHGVFHEVAAPERTVMTFEYEGTPGNVLLQTTSLEDVNGKTLLQQQLVFQSVQARDGMVEMGMEKGNNESLDRLEALLRE